MARLCNFRLQGTVMVNLFTPNSLFFPIYSHISTNNQPIISSASQLSKVLLKFFYFSLSINSLRFWNCFFFNTVIVFSLSLNFELIELWILLLILIWGRAYINYSCVFCFYLLEVIYLNVFLIAELSFKVMRLIRAVFNTVL